MNKFPPSVPRRQFWSHNVGKDCCPDCGADLEQEYHSFSMLVEEDYGDIVEFAVGNDAGWFCTQCSIVVLDTETFGEFAGRAIGKAKGDVSFVVLGIVDLEAVPEEKRHLPFDDEDNPLPLVEFANVVRKGINPRERAKARAKKRRKKKKSRHT